MKNAKRTNVQTHNKGIMIHTRILMSKRIITISIINRRVLQKKKILQTEFHKHNRNFRDSKTDKQHDQLVIVLWNTFSENCDIHRDFHAFFT